MNDILLTIDLKVDLSSPVYEIIDRTLHNIIYDRYYRKYRNYNVWPKILFISYNVLAFIQKSKHCYSYLDSTQHKINGVEFILIPIDNVLYFGI